MLIYNNCAVEISGEKKFLLKYPPLPNPTKVGFFKLLLKSEGKVSDKAYF
jgi:hypothetical protein